MNVNTSNVQVYMSKLKHTIIWDSSLSLLIYKTDTSFVHNLTSSPFLCVFSCMGCPGLVKACSSVKLPPIFCGIRQVIPPPSSAQPSSISLLPHPFTHCTWFTLSYDSEVWFAFIISCMRISLPGWALFSQCLWQFFITVKAQELLWTELKEKVGEIHCSRS